MTPADTAAEAAERFRAAFQETISCITPELFQYPQAEPAFVERVLVLARGHGVPLGEDGDLEVSVSHRYVVVSDPDMGDWRIQSAGYMYSVDSHRAGGEVLSYQWHPNGKSWCQVPHLDVRGAVADHLPTGRVALEQVVRLLIEDLNVEPLRDDWDVLLTHNEHEFRRGRQWA